MQVSQEERGGYFCICVTKFSRFPFCEDFQWSKQPNSSWKDIKQSRPELKIPAIWWKWEENVIFNFQSQKW